MLYNTDSETLHKAINFILTKEELEPLLVGSLATAVGVAFQAACRDEELIENSLWAWKAISDGVLLYKAGWLDEKLFTAIQA